MRLVVIDETTAISTIELVIIYGSINEYLILIKFMAGHGFIDNGDKVLLCPVDWYPHPAIVRWYKSSEAMDWIGVWFFQGGKNGTE